MNIPINCERCGKESSSMIVSMFSEEWICMACKESERKHPDYKSANNADIEEIKKGNFNYKGVGKPSDL